MTVNPIVYERLVAAARQRATVPIAEVARLAGLSTGSATDDKILGLILDNIAEHEAGERRPLLPVVVVAAAGGPPGAGLARYARRVGLADDPASLADELARVHAHWAKR